FRPLDVFRWEICQVDCTGADSLDDVIDRFQAQLKTWITAHKPLPLGLRVILTGTTKAHQQLCSQRTRLIAEIRTTAAVASSGTVWIEQVRSATNDKRESNLSADGNGPLDELVRYLDELPNDPQAISQLTDELKDLARKLPPE